VYVGDSVTFTAFANGQAPLTVQWYKAPSTLLAGQTNLTLTLSSLTTGDSGNYYIIANNPLGSTQSGNGNLNVLALTPPIITQQPQPQSVYVHQTATFSVSAIGQQPLSYQWKFEGNPIAGATQSTLNVTDATSGKAGNYSVTITNVLGQANSASASLAVLTLPAGSYGASIIESQPLVYYRFSDAGDTTTNTALNLGTLGAANNGVYEGGYTANAGPQPPAFPIFESTNIAFEDVSLSADVKIPAINLDTNSGAHATFAAWVYKEVLQASFAGIIFSRANSAACGLGVKTLGGDMLEYHWNNLYFDFNSGLLVPDSQWTFVALVVEPAQATFYMNDGSGWQTSVNATNHSAVPLLDNNFIGYDPAQTTRRFYGRIDEPMIFGRSLSASEINALYTGTVVAPVHLDITRSGNNIILTWPQGTLQEANNVTGPYNDLTSATSPYTNAPAGGSKFYRVKVQ
jgi:hypothetical protein